MSNNPKSATRASTRIKATASTPAARTTRAAAKASTTPFAPAETGKRPSSRKPLASRDNSPDLKPTAERIPFQAKASSSKATSLVDVADDAEREPIQAFLRLRPHIGDEAPSSLPYLEPLSDNAVRMSDPSSSSSHSRSTINPSSIYTFSHVFSPATHQSEFFGKTTLPLVKNLLEGQNGLLFTYGVTNSGKTYTIQGGSHPGSAGILPRTLDVIFNSVEGLQGDGRYRPVRLQGVELADDSAPPIATSPVNHGSSARALADVLDDTSADSPDIDPTTLALDRNHEYTIWLSYAEVYNEKVYDLLASVDDPSALPSSTPTNPRSQSSNIPRPTSTFLNLPLPSSQSHPLLLTRKALPVKPCPSSDGDGSPSDTSAAGKYISGLRQLRIESAAQAKALLKLGQLHRRVFGTLANSQSSRSHALVTIKVLRVHRGERNDPTSIQTSRLTLVDLAGSERTKHTHTSGDRLREAGNINKSLMVLGQCMETMRANQRALARSLSGGVHAGSRLDTRDVKKGLAVVPFRHSKLTEILMDYFVGDGRAVMIVNVNPHDTGYDENSHVMKFAALAREVCTTAATAVPRPVPVGKSKKAMSGVRVSDVVPHRRTVTLSTSGPGRKVSETHLEVLEEDEEPGDGDDHQDGDDEPINPLVDALFDEIENLRMQLFESEMRSALIEAETREEVMHEMEQRMQAMEKMFTRRLLKEVEQNEKKMDAKLDMLHRSGLLGSTPAPARREASDDDDEEELEDIEEEEEAEATSLDEISDTSRSPSPLANKDRGKKKVLSLQPLEYSGHSGNDADEDKMDAETSDAADETIDEYGDDGEDHDIDDDDADDLEEWTPSLKPARPTPKQTNASRTSRRPTRSTANSLGGLERQLGGLKLDAHAQPDDSIVIVPDRKARKEAVAHAGPGAEYVPGKGEVDTVKKKKRVVGKKTAVEDASSKPDEGGRQLRRSVRQSR